MEARIVWVCNSWEKRSRRAFIANWLALHGVGFWARADALVLLEQEWDDQGVSLVVVGGRH